MHTALIYVAAATMGFWGAWHLMVTQGVVAGFGEITADNRRIITMEWIVEGVALVSTATFVTVATALGPQGLVSSAVYAVAIGTLAVLAIVSFFTGFRISFLPFKLCPIIFGAAAVLIAWGAWF